MVPDLSLRTCIPGYTTKQKFVCVLTAFLKLPLRGLKGNLGNSNSEMTSKRMVSLSRSDVKDSESRKVTK